MKFNIFDFNQKSVLKLVKVIEDEKGRIKELRLDVTDLLILKVMADFIHRNKVVKYTIGDKIYCSVQYSLILEDLPILNIKRQALADRFSKMEQLGVIEKHIERNQAGSFTAFRLTDIYEHLLYSANVENRPQEYLTTSANVVDYKTKDYNTNTKTNNINIISVAKNTRDDKKVYFEDSKIGKLVTKIVDPKGIALDVYDYTEFLKEYNAPEFDGIDMIYYYNVVKDWSYSSNTKRNDRGWRATIRNFIRGDKEKNKLHTLNDNDAKEAQYREWMRLEEQGIF